MSLPMIHNEKTGGVVNFQTVSVWENHKQKNIWTSLTSRGIPEGSCSSGLVTVTLWKYIINTIFSFKKCAHVI